MAFIQDMDGADVPGGSDNSTGVGSPLVPDSKNHVLTNFVEGEGGLLAVAYGEHLIAGTLIQSQYNPGPPPSLAFVVALGDGQNNRWDSVVNMWFAGEELFVSPDNVTPGYRFSPGAISGSVFDPVQPVDPFMPTGLAYSGVACLNVLLPEHLAVEDRPDKSITRVKCMWTMDYTNNGGEIAKSYSTNPARVAADRIRRYYEQRFFNDLALAYRRFRDRINWDAWANWRDVCDELIEWNDGVQVRNIKRFEYHGAFTENAVLADVLDDICGASCAFWQDDGERITFLTPFDITPVHNFNLQNIVTGSFTTQPRDIREIPNHITAKFRNLDDPKLTPAPPQPVTREDLIAKFGKVARERNLPNMTHSQAQRILARQLRLEGGIVGRGTPVTCSLKGQWDSLHVLPGDYVTVTHPVAGWNYQLCLVLAASPDSPEDAPDQSDFTLQTIEGNLYSDLDHGPAQGAIVLFNGPSDIADLVFHYEARNPGASYADGDPFTDMADLSGNGRHLTLLDHTYRFNSGSPSIQIASSSAYDGGFNASSILDLAQPDQFSAFFVSKFVTGGGGTAVNSLLACGTLTNMVRFLNPYTDGKIYVACGNVLAGGQPASVSVEATSSDNLWHIWEYHRNGNTVEVFCDGVGITMTAAFAAPTLVSTGVERCHVFGSPDASFLGGRANHKAGVLYRRYLTSVERSKIRAYLTPIV